MNEELVNALKDVVSGSNWQKIGEAAELAKIRCRRLYCQEGDDIVLIAAPDGRQFFALDASCPHEGGPLDQGDIEDMDDRMILYCPWHMYDFNVQDGTSSSGLVQDTYEVQVYNGEVFIHIEKEVSLSRTAKPVAEVPVKASPSGPNPEQDDDSLTFWAVTILNTSNAAEKARLTMDVARRWREGEITCIGHHQPPSQPPRDSQLTVVAPGKEKKRGKGGTLASRVSNLHSLANIEQWAIDLSWDIIARFACCSVENQKSSNKNDSPNHKCDIVKDFSAINLTENTSHIENTTEKKDNFVDTDSNKGSRLLENSLQSESKEPTLDDNLPPLPKEFFDDFVKVANDEANHFSRLSGRLESLGSYYGALPVHNGLWESAAETSHSLLARLAIVHMVHEARGLDVQPQTLAKFVNHKDEESADILRLIYQEEITHVAAGLRWFSYCCNNAKFPLMQISTFHALVKQHFKAFLKPPFNTEGRQLAGMGPEWYEPLVKPR